MFQGRRKTLNGFLESLTHSTNDYGIATLESLVFSCASRDDRGSTYVHITCLEGFEAVKVLRCTGTNCKDYEASKK
jgi:hypothetical protein